MRFFAAQHRDSSEHAPLSQTGHLIGQSAANFTFPASSPAQLLL